MTLLISHPSFLAHDTGQYHPERPDRLRAVLAGLDDAAIAHLVSIVAPAATLEQLTRVHPQEYVDAILGIRPPAGELVQIDGSHHDWFEGRSAKCCLLAFIDDATGRVLGARFFEGQSATNIGEDVSVVVISCALASASSTSFG